MKNTFLFQILFSLSLLFIAGQFASCNLDGTTTEHGEGEHSDTTAAKAKNPFVDMAQSVNDHTSQVGEDIKDKVDESTGYVRGDIKALADELAPVIAEAKERKRLKDLRDALTEALLTTTSINMDSIKEVYSDVITAAHVQNRAAFWKALKKSKNTEETVAKFEKIFNALPPKGAEYATASTAVQIAGAKADDAGLRAELAAERADKARIAAELQALKAKPGNGSNAKALADAKEAQRLAELEREDAVKAKAAAEAELARVWSLSKKKFGKEKKAKGKGGEEDDDNP